MARRTRRRLSRPRRSTPEPSSPPSYNLRRAGVQNTKREQRLRFTRLEPYPGVCVQAVGDYAENGQSKTVAIAIGPEFGTVGPELIREAAKEAVRMADLLVVCGFAFDPLAGEEASTLGRLTILQARMNPDLAMGDELLKKTGSGDLFMVFGEPDIEVKPAGEGMLTVEVCGLDVYDPTTGVLRSSSVDDIAAWFLDTDYEGDAFFVRHAYFLGADDPYERLRKALRADISDEAWATVNSTVSRPFPKPRTGKAAIKVINHYGDEVMKVFGVCRIQPRRLSMDALVTQSEDVAWGAAVIAGTRVPVETLFDYFERGKTLDDFLEQFPTVEREKAVAILEQAKEGVTAQAATG